MSLDPVKNFAKGTLSAGISSTDTSLTLQSGDGDKFPDPSSDGEYNCVIWNSTDYGDPADDPNKEIVRVTAKSTDTFTITRGQEGTSAVNHNTSGKTYKMILAFTKKSYDDISKGIESNIISINQTSHGFSVGDVLKFDGSSYTKAKADSSANAEVVGIVSEVTDSDNFKLLSGGKITGLSGLTAGSVYFLSDSTAGALTSTEPTTEGSISKPLLIAISSTEGQFFNFRGNEITSATTNGLPSGAIIIWSGTISNIPSGYVLCDGNNSTPNLTGRFVVHADADSSGTYNVGDTGGENTHTLTTAELPAHNHGSAGAHTHNIGFYHNHGYDTDGLAEATTSTTTVTTGSAGSHTHASVGSGSAHENRPPYYALAYIMKT